MLFMKYLRWFYESRCVFEIWFFLIHFEPKTEVLKCSIAERQVNHPTPHYHVVKLFDISNLIV